MADEPTPAPAPQDTPAATDKTTTTEAAKPADKTTESKVPKTAATDAGADNKADNSSAEGWRSEFAEGPEDLAIIDRYLTKKDWMKAHRNLLGLASKKGVLPSPEKPGKDATPEQVAEWRKSVGLPEKPEDYFADMKLPDGRLVGEDDKPILDAYAKVALESGIPKEVAQRSAQFLFDMQEKQLSQRLEADEKERTDNQRTLRSDEHLGVDYHRTVNAMSTLRQEMGEEVFDLIVRARLPNGSLLGNDVGAVKFLGQMATEMFPQATFVQPLGSGARNDDEFIRETRQIMASKDADEKYWKDPQRQADFGAALARQEKAAARAR